MWLDTHDARQRNFGVSLQDFEDWRRSSHAFSGMTLVQSGSLSISGDDRSPESYAGGYISGNAFDLVGVQPVYGRGFLPADDEPGAPAVVLISGDIWKSRYGSDPSVLGKTIRVNSLPATLIGIMPPGLKWPFQHEVWLTVSQLPPVLRGRGRQGRGYAVYARLADGVTLEQARAEMKNVSAQLAQQYQDTNKDITAEVNPFLDRVIGGGIKTIFWSLMGAVAFVLLIACSNVANLLLARAAHRSREIAVRVSLGATRWRIVRQLLVESVLLSCISGLVGLSFGFIMIRWFDGETQSVGKPYWMTFNMDARFFAFFAIVCVLTGVIFGLAPALHISKTNVNEVLKESGRSGSGGLRARRWAAALVVVELTLTLVLLAGAGFMMRSFMNLYRIDTGIETSHLLTMQFLLPTRKYNNPQMRNEFLRRMEDRLSSVNTVTGASVTNSLPLFGGAARQLEIDGRSKPEKPQIVTVLDIGARYFDAAAVNITRGRSFTAVEGTPGREVAIINQRLAALYFANEEPIGQRIRLVDDTPGAAKFEWATIVGLVPNIRQRSSQDDPAPDPVVYIPYPQDPTFIGAASLIVRGQMTPGTLTPLLRKEIGALDPDLPLNNVRTMDENLVQIRWFSRVFGTMFSVFAGIAIVLSAVGLFAVTAYSVTQRTQEIGVRMALGAESRQVRWLILRRGLIHLAFGIAFGLAGAFGVGRVLRNQLFQTGSADPLTLVSITLFLAIIAIVACLWPAWQATRLNPVIALRYE